MHFILDSKTAERKDTSAPRGVWKIRYEVTTFLFVEYLFQIFRPKFQTLFQKNWTIEFLLFILLLISRMQITRFHLTTQLKKQKPASDHVSVNFNNE